MTISADLTFPVKTIPPGMTTAKHLDVFIREHEAEKYQLIVKINPTGIGEAFADRLESAGFVVVRTNEES